MSDMRVLQLSGLITEDEILTEKRKTEKAKKEGEERIKNRFTEAGIKVISVDDNGHEVKVVIDKDDAKKIKVLDVRKITGARLARQISTNSYAIYPDKDDVIYRQATKDDDKAGVVKRVMNRLSALVS